MLPAPHSANETRALPQGVWFPTHNEEDGRALATYEPSFPAPREPWLLTISRSAWHVTSNADYHATGGRIRVETEPGRLTFEYSLLPPVYDTRDAFRLNGEELLLQTGGYAWSGVHGLVTATRYVRVAPEGTAKMKALFAEVERDRSWFRCRANLAVEKDTGRSA
jgi:hypothetical protein